MLGIRTRGGRMEGANESTELRRHPFIEMFQCQQFASYKHCKFIVPIISTKWKFELNAPSSSQLFYGNNIVMKLETNATKNSKKSITFQFETMIQTYPNAAAKWIRPCPAGVQDCFWAQGSYGRQSKMFTKFVFSTAVVLSSVRWHSPHGK